MIHTFLVKNYMDCEIIAKGLQDISPSALYGILIAYKTARKLSRQDRSFTTTFTTTKKPREL